MPATILNVPVEDHLKRSANLQVPLLAGHPPNMPTHTHAHACTHTHPTYKFAPSVVMGDGLGGHPLKRGWLWAMGWEVTH